MGVRFLGAASAALAASAFLTACYSPNYGNGNVRCGGQNGTCPAGLLCGGDGLCHQSLLPPSDGGTWIEVTPSTSKPSPRRHMKLAYDGMRHKVVLFGGINGPYLGDTWEWDGTNWNMPSVAGTLPSARADHTMIYDGRQTILNGGLQDGTDSPDTWKWNGSAWTVAPLTGPSERRWWSAMAYDSARDRVVMFGGRNAPNVLAYDDTWEWDGAASTWTQRCQGSDSCAGGPFPKARYGHSMAYDSVRRKVVLYGGTDATEQLLGDTWEWDGVAWTSVCATSCGLNVRSFAAMAYDERNGATTLFGGDDGNYQGDTWRWNGTNWTRVGVMGPIGRITHAMTYDSSRQRLVLFGGWDGNNYLNDTWEF